MCPLSLATGPRFSRVPPHKTGMALLLQELGPAQGTGDKAKWVSKQPGSWEERQRMFKQMSEQSQRAEAQVELTGGRQSG